MAQNKKSVLLYCDLIHTVEKFSNEQAGKFFKHYLRYVNDLNPKTEDPLIEIVFEQVKQNLKRDLKKWEKRADNSRENGKKGGRPKKPKPLNNNLKNPVGFKKPVTDTVTVTDTVKVNTMSEKSDLMIFDSFRKKYSGTKRGNKTEFENFKKHKDWRTVLPLLEGLLTNQILSREQRQRKKMFVPSWKNLKTWINQRCWEDEITIETTPKVMSVFDKASQYEL